ncbi:R-linalool synthase QH1, chloroplastic-like [Bidens hawaiensis]|uniref:R-linalool synthase QH1, chloroplastic-like n=1 Tax=Bidens hawaiensis TaxID=980011 RepID=UPI00404918C0
MASMCLLAFPIPGYKNSTIVRNGSNAHKPHSSQSTTISVEPPVVRRSANYDPTLWSFDHIQSLSSNYTGESYVARANALKDTVKMLIRRQVGDVSRALELIDDLQRLGISYHFEDEIRDALESIYSSYYQTQAKWDDLSLNLKALGFRLLRQHGYQVPQEILNNFKDTIQNAKPHPTEDMVTVLNLYEASYLCFENESILDEVKELTTKYLKENLGNSSGGLSSLVSHALEFPLHWRVPRVEAKWYIEEYEKRHGSISIVTELAKLDFDMSQAIHLEDLKHTSRWWNNTRWDEKLSFARDRLVEHFMWSLGFSYDPKFSLGRRILTMVNSLITSIDDVYDVYGTLDELERFTDIVDRWDVNAMKDLPDYMKIAFLGFYNTINEISYNILTETGFLALPYLKKGWADYIKTYMVEARWYHGGHKPTLQEYLDNAYVSIGGPIILMTVNCLTPFSSSEEMLTSMERAENIIRYSSTIFRLANDLGTSSEEIARGDIPKSIQCYMNDTGANEEEARVYIKGLIEATWKKLNKERACGYCEFSKEFIDCASNIPRMTQFMYNDGDGHGHPYITESHVLSLLFNPVQGAN